MRGEVEVNSANQVVGAGQFPLFSLREITEINEAKFPVCDQYPKRAGVFAGIRFSLRPGSAHRIGLVGARQRSADVLARRGQHLHGNAFEWQPVAGLQHQMLTLTDCFLIVGV